MRKGIFRLDIMRKMALGMFSICQYGISRVCKPVTTKQDVKFVIPLRTRLESQQT